MLVDHIDIIAFQEKEIPALVVQFDRFPFINIMCVDYDIALPRLPEYL